MDIAKLIGYDEEDDLTIGDHVYLMLYPAVATIAAIVHHANGGSLFWSVTQVVVVVFLASMRGFDHDDSESFIPWAPWKRDWVYYLRFFR